MASSRRLNGHGWALTFEDEDGFTKMTLGMDTAAEFRAVKGFGAVELGQETLDKLGRLVASLTQPVADRSGRNLVR